MKAGIGIDKAGVLVQNLVIGAMWASIYASSFPFLTFT